MAMEDDWVDVAEEFCTTEEWVLLVGDEGAMSAVFFGRAAAGIGGGVAPPIPIAGPADAAAGCRGLVLFRGAWSRHYVSDPSAGVHHALPLPRRPHSHDAAIARDASGGGFSVVCAFENCFEIYASATGQWREVPAAAAAGVVAGSAAAFAGCVFWKTLASPGVLALDVASGTTRQIAPPPRSSDSDALWQLGVAASHLCASLYTWDGGIELYGLVAGDEWNLLYAMFGLPMVSGCGDTRPRPLRFESDHYEVLLRTGGRVLALDIVNGTAREARLEGAVLPQMDEAIVPWCRAVSTVLL